MQKNETGVQNQKGTKVNGINLTEGFIEELCSSTWKEVYKFVYYKVGNRTEAEDITQEAYVKALDYLRKENVVIDNYSNFLKTVAMNILRDEWRKKQRAGKQFDLEELSTMDYKTEDFTEESIRRELIGSALNCLSIDQKRVIELRILKGFSTSETARILKKKEATVRVIQYRALQELASVLDKNII